MSEQQITAVPNERGGDDKTRLTMADGVAVAAHHLDRDVAALVEQAKAGKGMTVTLIVTPEGYGSTPAGEVKTFAAAWSALVPENGSLTAAVEALAERATGDLEELPNLYAERAGQAGGEK
ncbi:hypothetical protein AB0A05_26930 [Streptomyces sp. NPDC046374]|uniref:hypothetical protein n=1 Tax=Streptomyces sp. NPDC046374 TaxID=3154917 RepID=UPI0033CF7E5A